MRRLERQFKRRGWDWSDYGSEFTIDHQLPCCAFDLHKAEQRAMCSHWSNLQVLSVEQNRIKNGQFSKAELNCFKTLWRIKYGKNLRQPELFKQELKKPECPFLGNVSDRRQLFHRHPIFSFIESDNGRIGEFWIAKQAEMRLGGACSPAFYPWLIINPRKARFIALLQGLINHIYHVRNES
jgi:hypothetical protein